MKNNKLIIYIFFCLLLFGSLYVNFMSYRSNQVQKTLMESLNSNNYDVNDINKFGNFNPDFPNLSQTALPVKSMMARYYLLSGDYNTALDLLNESSNVNPYIMFTESEKALVFENLESMDSFAFYAKKAFEGIPQNERHFVQYAKVLSFFKDSLELDRSYDRVKNSSMDFLHLAYLTSNFTIGRDYDSIKEKVNYIENKFQNNKEIKLVVDYLKYGEQNVKKAIETSKKANLVFSQSAHEQAANLYIEASKLNPGDYTHFENAGVSFMIQKKYEEAIPYFKHVIDSLNPNIGKSEYLIASCYENLGDIDSACKYLSLAVDLNFKNAFDAQAKLCFK